MGGRGLRNLVGEVTRLGTKPDPYPESLFPLFSKVVVRVAVYFLPEDCLYGKLCVPHALDILKTECTSL